jgi:hypothetical protein
VKGHDDLHRLAGQRRSDRQDVEALTQAVAGHHQRKEGQREGNARREQTLAAEVDEAEQAGGQGGRGPKLVSRSPGHFAGTNEHDGKSSG